MKNILFIMILMLGYSSLAHAQKKLSEITINNPYFEEIDIKEILDFDKYQEENFKNSRSRKTKVIVKENPPNAQHLRFKGTKDIIIIGARTNKKDTENWEKSIKIDIASYNVLGESYIEHLNLKNAKGVIQMFDDTISHKNYLYYQNKDKNISLVMLYVSNENNENRLKNMRLILQELDVK